MLEAICQLLRGLSSVDGGVESVLNQEAKDGVINLIRNVYGNHAADTIDNLFDITDEGGLHFRCFDEVEDAFRICLQGRG
jgi:hypothetical protein